MGDTYLKNNKFKLPRIKNILISTLNPDKYLIADQLAAIVLTELREGRGHSGLASQYRPIMLHGYSERGYAQYHDDSKSQVFYADLEYNTKLMLPGLEETALKKKVEDYRNNLLKYIDVHLALNYLHSDFVSPTKRSELKHSEFRNHLSRGIEDCQTLGFQLWETDS